ncbi:MAG: ATP-binding protein, partial [Bacteroidota bacterium]
YLSAFESQDGTVWLGSNFGFQSIRNEEISLYEYDQENLKSGPAFNFISGFFEDKWGRIWIATFGGGVSCLDREKNTFFHLNKADGLSNNICSAIEGNDRHVFVSSNGGISRIDIESLEIVNYTISDGLTSNEFAIASSYKHNNDFLFGNVNGLVAFKADDLIDSIYNSAPTITNFIANYTSAPYARIQKTLDVYPSDKIFSLEFSTMAMKELDQLVYQYKMDGFNDSWVSTDPSNRRATYILPPGEYVFNVKAINKQIETETRALRVVVHPAYYQTWWFFTLVGLAAITLVVLLSRYYSHQQLKEKLRKLEVQQKIQSERERISRDLHDNVGSQITYIATSINNLSHNENTEQLKDLGDFTRDTMRQLRETIWVINHDEVTLDELRTKVVDFLSEILRPHAEMTHQVIFPDTDQKLNPTRAINIFRIIQEAVNNSIKHANAQKLTITLELNDNPRLIIKDDGDGFDGKDKNGHFGLLNMRQRAQELGGIFEVESQGNDGTTITVTGLEIGQMT